MTMTNEELNTKVYEKLFDEQQKYKGYWVKMMEEGPPSVVAPSLYFLISGDVECSARGGISLPGYHGIGFAPKVHVVADVKYATFAFNFLFFQLLLKVGFQLVRVQRMCILQQMLVKQTFGDFFINAILKLVGSDACMCPDGVVADFTVECRSQCVISGRK